jgi:hypothetical protein
MDAVSVQIDHQCNDRRDSYRRRAISDPVWDRVPHSVFFLSTAQNRQQRACADDRAYLRRFRSQASLISKATITKMVATTIGPANIAIMSNILQLRERQRRRPRRSYCVGFGINCPLWTSCETASRPSSPDSHPIAFDLSGSQAKIFRSV